MAGRGRRLRNLKRSIMRMSRRPIVEPSQEDNATNSSNEASSQENVSLPGAVGVAVMDSGLNGREVRTRDNMMSSTTDETKDSTMEDGAEDGAEDGTIDGAEDCMVDGTKDNTIDGTKNDTINDAKDDMIDDAKDHVIDDVKDITINDAMDDKIDGAKDDTIDGVKDDTIYDAKNDTMDGTKDSLIICAEDGTVDGAVDSTINGAVDSAIDGAKHGIMDGAKDGTIDGAKAVMIDDAKDGTINGAKDGTVGGVKDGTIDSAKDGTIDGAKDGTIDGAKDSPKNGTEDRVMDGTMDGTTDGMINGAKNVTIDGAKDSPKDSAEDSVMDGTKDSVMDGTKDSVMDGSKDSVMDGTKDGMMDGTKDGMMDGAMDGAKDDTIDGAEDSSKDGAKDSSKDGAQDSVMDGTKDNVMDDVKDVTMDGVKGGAEDGREDSVTVVQEDELSPQAMLLAMQQEIEKLVASADKVQEGSSAHLSGVQAVELKSNLDKVQALMKKLSSTVQQIPQLVEPVEKKKSVDQVPQPVVPVENKKSVCQVPQPVVPVENKKSVHQVPRHVGPVHGCGNEVGIAELKAELQKSTPLTREVYEKILAMKEKYIENLLQTTICWKIREDLTLFVKERTDGFLFKLDKLRFTPLDTLSERFETYPNINSITKRVEFGFRVNGSFQSSRPPVNAHVLRIYKVIKDFVDSSWRPCYCYSMKRGFWKSLSIVSNSAGECMVVANVHLDDISTAEAVSNELKPYVCSLFENGPGRGTGVVSFHLRVTSNSSAAVAWYLQFGEEYLVNEMLGLRTCIYKDVVLHAFHGVPSLCTSIAEMLDLNTDSAVVVIGTTSILNLFLAQKCRSVYCWNVMRDSLRSILDKDIELNGIKNLSFVDTLSGFTVPTSEDKAEQPREICAVFTEAIIQMKHEISDKCFVELKHLCQLSFIKRVVYCSSYSKALYRVLNILCKSSEGNTDPFVMVKVIPVDVTPTSSQLDILILLVRASELSGQTEELPAVPVGDAVLAAARAAAAVRVAAANAAVHGPAAALLAAARAAARAVRAGAPAVRATARAVRAAAPAVRAAAPAVRAAAPAVRAAAPAVRAAAPAVRAAAPAVRAAAPAVRAAAPAVRAAAPAVRAAAPAVRAAAPAVRAAAPVKRTSNVPMPWPAPKQPRFTYTPPAFPTGQMQAGPIMNPFNPQQQLPPLPLPLQRALRSLLPTLPSLPSDPQLTVDGMPMMDEQIQDSVVNAIQKTIIQSLENTVASKLKSQIDQIVENKVVHTLCYTVVNKLLNYKETQVPPTMRKEEPVEKKDTSRYREERYRSHDKPEKSETMRKEEPVEKKDTSRYREERYRSHDKPEKSESSFSRSFKSSSTRISRSPVPRTTKIPSLFDNPVNPGNLDKQFRPSTDGRDSRRRQAPEDDRHRSDTNKYRRTIHVSEEYVRSSRDSRHPKARSPSPDSHFDRRRFGSGSSRESESRKHRAVATGGPDRDHFQDVHRRWNEVNTTMEVRGGPSSDRNYSDGDPRLDRGFSSATRGRDGISDPSITIRNISQLSNEANVGFSPQAEYGMDINKRVKRVSFKPDSTVFDSSYEPELREQESGEFYSGRLDYDAGSKSRWEDQTNSVGHGIRDNLDSVVKFVASAISGTNTSMDTFNQTRWNEQDMRTGFGSDSRLSNLKTIPISDAGINSEFENFSVDTVSGPRTHFDAGSPVMWARRETVASFDVENSYDVYSDSECDGQSVMEDRRTHISEPNASYDSVSQSRQENRETNTFMSLSESFYGKRY